MQEMANIVWVSAVLLAALAGSELVPKAARWLTGYPQRKGKIERGCSASEARQAVGGTPVGNRAPECVHVVKAAREDEC